MKTKPLIVCVDDEKIILNSLSRQLQRHFNDSYEFDFSESGEEALKSIHDFAQEGYEIVMVIADQIMPSMKGDELLIQIHKEYPRAIKILLTGQASLESAVNAINHANLFRYLTKPWSEDDFLLTVEKGLEQYYLLDQTQKQFEMITRFVPYQFLERFSKTSFLDIQLGDYVHREFSILFSRLPDTLPPVEQIKIINEALRKMEPIIQKYNGFVEKYGVSFVTLFSNPEDALSAAIELHKAIPDIQADLLIEKLLLAIVGYENRLQPIALYDLNLQELAAKPGDIIASRAFVDKFPHLSKENVKRIEGKDYFQILTVK